MTPNKNNLITKNDPEYQQHKEKVFKKIDLWKKRLLDLSRRNRLLYFTTSRTNTVSITSPSPEQIFERLVNKGHKLSFAIPKKEQQLILRGIDSSEEPLLEDSKKGDLETSTPVGELQRKLYRLRRDWRTWQEEQGVHTLFLTFGMLHWKEAAYQQEQCFSPLILIPVTLEKEGLQKPYSIEFADEDIVVNPALAYKLEADFKIQLPELTEEVQWESIALFFKSVQQKVKSSDWLVSSDQVWLGRFSFEKFVMYQDLEDQKDNAVSHPIVSALAGINIDRTSSDIPLTEDVDHIDPKDVFPVFDADSSQCEVLLRSRSGENLVVQGPPGTGKSQTIVNLIAQSLRDRKKVLFVSEKMAALEVVFRRLREIGLSFACLEVHSHRSNKAKVVEELGNTLKQNSKPSVPIDAENRFKRLKQFRSRLNEYVKELHRPRGAISEKVFNAHGHLAKYMDAPDISFTLLNIPILNITTDTLEKCKSAVRRLSENPNVWDNYYEHPWVGADIDLTTYTIETRDSIINLFVKFKDVIKDLYVSANPTAIRIGLGKSDTYASCRRLAYILKSLTELKPISKAWFHCDSKNLEDFKKSAIEAKGHTKRLKDAEERLKTDFEYNLINIVGLQNIRFDFRDRFNSKLRWLNKSYWQQIKLLKAYWISCIQLLSATLGFKDLCWSFESETFSRTIIEPGFDLCQMVL